MPKRNKSSAQIKGVENLIKYNKKVFKTQDRDSNGRFGKVKVKKQDSRSKANFKDFAKARLRLRKIRSNYSLKFLFDNL